MLQNANTTTHIEANSLDVIGEAIDFVYDHYEAKKYPCNDHPCNLLPRH